MTGHLERQSQNPGRRKNIKQPFSVVWSLIIGLNMRKRLGSVGDGLTGTKLDFCFRGMVLPWTLISQSSETRTSTWDGVWWAASFPLWHRHSSSISPLQLASASCVVVITLHCTGLFIFLSPSLYGEQLESMGHGLFLSLLWFDFLSVVLISEPGIWYLFTEWWHKWIGGWICEWFLFLSSPNAPLGERCLHPSWRKAGHS